ncbi:serine O-acetyltransferase [Blastococcus sp. Marseille-P5729]|uniref:serine O-acetyltransferase n=1 Tax=Blastococcus sp. Marseille-P5729 TaxID=2086582 RepID=UPI000D0E5EC2|nr:serine O-acetyltransferase [Blastococcus sp. Marseille-P5729]
MNPVADHEVWSQIRIEAERDAQAEPILAPYLTAAILRHDTLTEALAAILGVKLGTDQVPADSIASLVREAYATDPQLIRSVIADLQAVATRDPACGGYTSPLLHFKGFQSLQAYRAAHVFWNQERCATALYLQGRISEVFAVDIHPAARIGKGIMFDHATSVVIGATAVVEDDFSMLHEVTLGGTGKQDGDRHPKIGRGVMIGAGAKVLGNIQVGEGAKIGAGSVVLDPVPPHTTVAGIPARPVSFPAHSFPALEMDQSFDAMSDLVESLASWEPAAEESDTPR